MTPTKQLLQKLRLHRGFFYMATPYSKYPKGKDAAYEKALFYMNAFLREKIFVYSPIVHCHDLAKKNNLPKDHTFWEEFNIRMMLASCGGLFVCMEGYHESVGMTMEAEFMQVHKIPFWEFIPGEDKGETWL